MYSGQRATYDSTVSVLSLHSSCARALQSDKQKLRAAAELSAASSARVAILLVSVLKAAISNCITHCPQPLTAPLVCASVAAPKGAGPWVFSCLAVVLAACQNFLKEPLQEIG